MTNKVCKCETCEYYEREVRLGRLSYGGMIEMKEKAHCFKRDLKNADVITKIYPKVDITCIDDGDRQLDEYRDLELQKSL